MGCAWYEFFAQVQSLGTTLTLYSYHMGQGYDDVYGDFWYSAQTSATYNIPGPPSLTFNQVDARNPNNVLWGITTSGASPWQVNFYFAGNFQITQGGVAQTDQMAYPSGWSQAALQGVNYGIAFNGQTCSVLRADNISRGDSNGTTVDVGAENDIEPGTLTLASVAQVGAYTLTQVAYYDNCAFLLSPFSMTTRLLGVSDSINTLNNPNFLDVDIMSFVPTAMYPPTFAPISLPPATWNVITPPIPPGQEGRFKTNEFDWSAPTMQNWIPNPPPCTGLCAVQQSQVCPTGLTVGSQASMVAANPGCWFVSIP